MELKDVIANRGSVRNFSPACVEVEDIREMVRMAGMAPSVNNSQPWRFIAVTNFDLKQRMGSAVHQKVRDMIPEPENEDAERAKKQVEWFSTFFADAPAVIAVATSPYQAIVDRALPSSGLSHEDMNAIRNHPDIQSLGACIQNLLLAATDMGYGGCWLSGPLVARDELQQMLGISDPWHLAAMVAVGKPAGEMKQSPKKPLEEIFEIRE